MELVAALEYRDDEALVGSLRVTALEPSALRAQGALVFALSNSSKESL
jgi:hypothetical protein